jgi:hypothetical protein
MTNAGGIPDHMSTKRIVPLKFDRDYYRTIVNAASFLILAIQSTVCSHRPKNRLT